ncbi:MAG: zinc metalloprotease HtpX [Thermoplasmata archaeon]|nr:MAG: zinc metalloprotease HtpX [Thermoplasmata archaeon]
MGAMARLFVMFVLLMLIFAVIGWFIGEFFLGNWMYGFVIFFAIAVVMNVVSYFFSDKLVLSSYGAQIVGPEAAPKLYRTVERVALRADVPMPKVAMIPMDTPNAFATGRNPDNAVVAATEGLLRMLSDEELEGVIAHEMAHVKNRDILIMTVAATIVAAIAVFARIAFWQAIINRDVNVWLLLLVAVTAPIAALLVRAAISRNQEYRADATGAAIIGKPWALASALKQLERGVERYPIKSGSPATSHLFIVNPFKGGFAGLFSTHPPTEKRVARLMEMV